MVMKMFHDSSKLMPKREEAGMVEEQREGRLNERRDLSSHLLSI